MVVVVSFRVILLILNKATQQPGMPGKQAKILSVGDVNDLLVFASCTRHPLRNRVIVLLAAKAGLRAGEIANLTWEWPRSDRRHRFGDRAARPRGQERQRPVDPGTPSSAGPRRLSQSFNRQRTCRSIRARRSDDAPEYRGLVQPRIPQHRSARLLVPFRTPDVHHPGGPAGSSGGWFAARCPIARWPPVNSDDATLHRRRH